MMSLGERIQEKRKITQRRAERRKNCLFALCIFGGYAVIYLAGRIFGNISDTSIIGWLFGTDPRWFSYLYGWLVGNDLFWVACAVSVIPALYGKRKHALSTLFGFALGLLFGELFGEVFPSAEPCGTHYGWAIWIVIFLASVTIGIILEKRRSKTIP